MAKSRKTKNEMTAIEQAEEQGIRVRAKRRFNLPDSWSGSGRKHSCSTNNWKRHRKNQYR